MNRLTRTIREVIYSMKRDYGFPVTLHRIVGEVLDVETGKKTQTKVTHDVPRAIVLPSVINRRFTYDLAFIAENKEFTYGGFYDSGNRRLILDAQELGNFKVKVDDYFHFDNRRWDIKEVHEFESQAGFIVVAREDKTTQSRQIVSERLYHRLNLTQEAVNE